MYTYLEYVPQIHKSFIADLEAEANKDHSQTRTLSIAKVYKDVNRKVVMPDILFPSVNYKRLDAIIEGFFTVVQNTKMFNTQGILINGEPGLGKSNCIWRRWGNMAKC